MSNTMIPEPRSPRDEEIDRHPSIEPWLRVSFVALLPLVLAFYLAEEWRPYLFVAGHDPGTTRRHAGDGLGPNHRSGAAAGRRWQRES